MIGRVRVSRALQCRQFWGLSGKPAKAHSASLGVFQVSGLHNPQDWHILTEKVISQCTEMRSQLKKEPTTANNAARQLRLLDGISNSICSIIDAAELCRNVHNSEEWRHAAEGCFDSLSRLISELNADTTLYDVACRVANDPEILADLTPEEQRFSLMMKLEFERDGIQLSAKDREEVRRLADAKVNAETALSQSTLQYSNQFFQVPREALREFLPSLWQDIPQQGGSDTVTLNGNPLVCNSIVSQSTNPQVREAVLRAMHSLSRHGVLHVANLLVTRHLLAEKLGFESYAHSQFVFHMMKDPESVKQSLRSLAKKLQPIAEEEFNELLALKEKEEGSANGSIKEWDVTYYMRRHKLIASKELSGDYAAYISLPKALYGLQVVCKEAFGIDLKLEDVAPDESWAEGLKKFTVSHESEGPLGTIFLDLHMRPFKYSGSAHFTVRGGCAMDDDINQIFQVPPQALHNGFQLPVIALVLNIPEDYFDENHMETLFHEFGHALHSILSRTTFQHLSGTRAASDFVETPSQLFEMLIWDSGVASKFAKHFITGSPISEELLEQLKEVNSSLPAITTLKQILLSLVDLELHSSTTCGRLIHLMQTEKNPDEIVDYISSITNSIHREVMPGMHPPPVDIPWVGRFTHLNTYPTSYYGYLYNKAFATQLHRNLISEGGTLSADAGQRLWQQLLKPGGSQDALQLLTNALNGEKPSIESIWDDVTSAKK